MNILQDLQIGSIYDINITRNLTQFSINNSFYMRYFFNLENCLYLGYIGYHYHDNELYSFFCDNEYYSFFRYSILKMYIKKIC